MRWARLCTECSTDHSKTGIGPLTQQSRLRAPLCYFVTLALLQGAAYPLLLAVDAASSLRCAFCRACCQHLMLSQAVTHVQATKKVAQLALKLKQLKAFVHVSTGYVNSNLPRGSHIEEQVYPLYFANGDKLEHAKLAMQLAAMEPKKAEAEVLSAPVLPCPAIKKSPHDCRGFNMHKCPGTLGLLPRLPRSGTEH